MREKNLTMRKKDEGRIYELMIYDITKVEKTRGFIERAALALAIAIAISEI